MAKFLSCSLLACVLSGSFGFSAGANEPFSGLYPAVGNDGTIYYTLTSRKLVALTPELTEKWKLETTLNEPSSPAIGLSGTIYVGSGSGDLWAIDPEGNVKWRFVSGEGPLEPINPPYPRNGFLLAVSQDETIYSPSLKSGTVYVVRNGHKVGHFEGLPYTSPFGPKTPSLPLLGPNGTVYRQISNVEFVAETRNGTQLWASDRGKPLAIDYRGYIYALRSETLSSLRFDGSLVWNIELTAEETSLRISEDGTLFARTRSGNVVALSTNGVVLWNRPAESAGITPTAEGVLSLSGSGSGSPGFYTFVLQAEELSSSGDVGWQYESTSTPSRIPAISEPRLLANGKLLFQWHTTLGADLGSIDTPLQQARSSWSTALGNLQNTRQALPPFRTLTVKTTGAGTVLQPADADLPLDSTVTLTARPSPAHRFSHWSGDVSGTAESIHVRIDSFKNITAHFVAEGPRLSIERYDQGLRLHLAVADERAVLQSSTDLVNWRNAGSVSNTTLPKSDEHRFYRVYFP